eukprot:TRINITY_DN17423_c0_g1_i1.p1 TRINITY_DN17423_c0_g1~~TRINITY_DN17423_c0_g1_i1.p1  ORF type:complete len:388 (+),score=67.11 TRINITY_DN17423_c0_g1_i1:90-1253(+)
MFYHIYASESQLRNLLEYKYHGVDHSIMAKLLQPFWTKAVTFLPLTMAPNMVTLVGFYFIIGSFLLQTYFCPQLKGEAPSFVYFCHAICLFVYQTMDALDGKQARRTNNASPLGELFDHGCDAVTTSLLGLTLAGTMQLGAGWLSYIVLLSMLVAFYLAQIEEYHTGTLELGKVNVTEGQLMGMGIFALTGIMGPHFWVQDLLPAFGLKYHHIPVICQLLAVIGTVFTNGAKLFEVSQQPGKSASVVVLSLMPLILSSIFFTLWAYCSPTQVLVNQPIFFLLALGFLFAFLVGRIVFSRICNVPFSWFKTLTIPAIFGFINAYTNEMFVSERLLVNVYFLLCFAAYCHFAMAVIHLLCKFLNINCLTINNPSEQRGEVKTKQESKIQ